MAAKWFKCQPADEGFLDAAPLRLSESFEIALPAATVWGELTDERPLHWCRILQGVRWTSPRPFGVGTTRNVKALHGASLLRERYFRWDEEGMRHTFEAVETTNPMFRRLAEDYWVEPTGEGSCRFTWTIAVEPRPWARLGNPVNKALLGTLFADTRKHYGLAATH